MEEQNLPTLDASETPSVSGSVTGDAATPSVAPSAQPETPVGQGDLRPIWPTSGRGQGARAVRLYALLARLTATLCAALLFYVAWAPLATAVTSGDLRIAPTGPMYRFSLAAAELGAPPLYAMFGESFFGVWSALTIAGLLLSPLLWSRSPRWLQWLTSVLYACWFVAITGILIGVAQMILIGLPERLHLGAGPYLTTLYPYGTRVAIYTITPTFGLWLGALGALLGLAAAALAVMAFVTRQRASVPVIPSVQGEIVTPGASRAARSLPGAGAITSGLVLWAWGFFLLPWATLNCSQAPLLIGTCRGLPVTSALQIGLGATQAIFDPTAALFAITGLLLVGAIAILVAVWRRDITRTLCAWASLWLALALTSAGLAVGGAQHVVSNAPSVGQPTGDWRGDAGVLVVFLALLLVAIGLIPLWAVAVRAAQRHAADLRAQGA
jgi:hypothetical protein